MDNDLDPSDEGLHKEINYDIDIWAYANHQDATHYRKRLLNQHKESHLEKLHRRVGYGNYHNEQANNLIKKCICGAMPRHIGLKRETKSGRKSYVSISHCDNCGKEFVFYKS